MWLTGRPTISYRSKLLAWPSYQSLAAKLSPFAETFLKELAQAAYSLPGDFGEDYPFFCCSCQAAHLLEPGWGQTKVVEDANRELRFHERFDAPNTTFRVHKMWDVLHTRAIIKQHRRTELMAPVDDPALADAPAAASWLYTADDHESSIPAEHLLDTRDWATFTGATVPAQAAGLELVRHCVQ